MAFARPRRLSFQQPMIAAYAFIVSLMLGSALVMWYFGGSQALYHLVPYPTPSSKLTCEQLDCADGFGCIETDDTAECQPLDLSIEPPIGEIVTIPEDPTATASSESALPLPIDQPDATSGATAIE